MNMKTKVIREAPLSVSLVALTILVALATPKCTVVAWSSHFPIVKALASTRTTSALNSSNVNSNSESQSHWMDYLKFDKSIPTFDVIQKTIEYTSTSGYKSFSLKDIPPNYYSSDYIFRGPIVGPINRKDLVQTNTFFNLKQAYPDLDRQTFGYCIDPENPYRVMFFERWKGTHSGTLPGLGPLPPLEATNKVSISPVMPFSIVWDPEGKIIYESLTTAVDRFEGNTMGKVAVFGLLETAGLSLDNNVGNPILAWQQKLNRLTNGPAQVYSKKEDVPSWWKSNAVGAEKNDI